MPRIFDNLQPAHKLLPALQETLGIAYRADFCVGYFNLHGWQLLDEQIANWTGGEGAQCRLLVGMQRRPQAELALRNGRAEPPMDQQSMVKLRREAAEEFRTQLTTVKPNNRDEAALRRLARQLRAEQVVVRLFLRHPLHAKLYLLSRHDAITPLVGYMGSSNLTYSGLTGNGELNIDVVEQDAAQKLAGWFNNRWEDTWSVDISADLAQIIEESWARETPLLPYHIYLKMVYHLSREARAGLAEFSIPPEFGNKLFDYQAAAVKLAARHLNQRRGVLIGDVVGLGKTIMATAVAKIAETPVLVICPKNLTKMWQWYLTEYEVVGQVLSITDVQRQLPRLRQRYRLLLIDESHNLRNREGKRYKAIQDYIKECDSKCILLTATPYNKSYLDLSSQLRLFISDSQDLGIRPERYIRELGGETEFQLRHQASVRSLSAFEKSEYAEDWRDLMSLFTVRRTRSFIRHNYAQADEHSRRYLTYDNGSRAYFPDRLPRRVEITPLPHDPYARLYADDIVDTLNDLRLPRYGLANYVLEQPSPAPSKAENNILEDLSRGGRRLMGFSRTGLFKRLESSGYAFLLSVARHILRNHIFLYALENDLPLPIGTQDVAMLDSRFSDGDLNLGDETETDGARDPSEIGAEAQQDFAATAANIYALYQKKYKSRFKWLRASLLNRAQLSRDLRADAESLQLILQECGQWNPAHDSQLNALHDLLVQQHPHEKVLIFSQFADTVTYLTQQLQARGVPQVAGVTGDTADPTELAWRFSPTSNDQRGAISPAQEVRVLIATDVLSEGQNLQDAHIVVNYDLPWAIIRLIQRVGRVDRIGQQAPQILAYAFWPAEGLERLINLRQRLRQRLRENAEVVGADETFFEDETTQTLVDLYHERAGVLDEGDDGEVDLVSHAYQIWKNATEADPELKKIVPNLPSEVYSAKGHIGGLAHGPHGVLLFMETARGYAALAWLDEAGQSFTESQFAILRAAACTADTPPQPRHENHHELVAQGVEFLQSEQALLGGQLGRPSGPRAKSYARLKGYIEQLQGTLFPASEALVQAVHELYTYPLQETAKETLNRQLRSRINDPDLAELVLNLHKDGRLCHTNDDPTAVTNREPQIICSLGLVV